VRADRESRQEERREVILQAALDVVAERGLSDLRMSDISDRAGMSAGHVLYYFKTREAVLMQALRFIEDRFHAAADEELVKLPAGPERLRRLLELDLPGGRGDPRWALWLEAWTLAPHDDDIAELISELDARWVTRLRQVVREGIAAGEFECEDVPAFALRFSALFDGVAVRLVTGTKRTSKRSALKTCMQAAADDLAFANAG
jgi:AcrR family transcriptional regulator